MKLSKWKRSCALCFIALLSVELSCRVAAWGYHFYRDKILFSEISKANESISAAYSASNQKRIPESGHLIFHPYLSYIPRPNQVSKNIIVNAQSFRRDTEVPLIKSRNATRIMITGGSVAWGAGSSDNHHTIAAIMEKRLTDAGQETEVVNAGVWAYCLAQETLRILLYLKEYSPDVIIMYSGINDAYYAYRGIDTLHSGNDFFDVRGLVRRAYGEGATLVNGIFGAHYSDNDETIYRFNQRPAIDDYFIKAHFALDLLRYMWFIRTQSVHQNQFSIPPEDYLQNVLRPSLELLEGYAKQHHAQVVYVLQPSLFVPRKNLSNVEESILKRLEYISNFPEAREYFEHFYKLVPALLAKYPHIKFISQVEVFRDVEETLFSDPFHFGDKGNVIVGNRLADAIIDLRWNSPSVESAQ